MFTRRQIVATAATGLLAAPAILSQARAARWFGQYPFSLGVSAGEPSQDGFVIWTRIAPDPLSPHGGMPMSPVPVTWEVSEKTDFSVIVAKGEYVARPEMGHSVHVEVTGLQPGRPYWYRFFCGGEKSVRGLAKTMPPAGASLTQLKFGVAGCQNYEDGLYTAFNFLAREDLAFVFHYGDYIYENRSYEGRPGRSGTTFPKVRHHLTDDIYDITDYRHRYAQYTLDPDLQFARSRQTWFPTFDDHEIVDNWVGDFDNGEGHDSPPEYFRLRKAAAFQAWYEHMPVRRSMWPQGSLLPNSYRQARFGNLLSIDFLDTRQFRSDQPCGDGFRTYCPDVAKADAQVLGSEQEAWLMKNLQRRDAKWNCLAQQVMMMALDRRTGNEPEKILNFDSWASYDVPRKRLLSRIKGLDNVIVLTGDEHQNFAGELLDGDKPVAVEFVSTSISSGGDGSDRRSGSDTMLANNPQLKFINDQRGYLICDVQDEAWSTDYMVVDQISQPGGKLSKRATISVARGEPKLNVA